MAADSRVLAICGIYTQTLAENRAAQLQLVSIIIGVFLLTIFGAWWYMRVRRKARVTTPWEKVLLELQKIDPEAMQAKKEFKDLYYDLTRLVKWYVEQRFFWPVSALTDAEFAHYLQGSARDTLVAKKMLPILEHALGVKYADEGALRAQAVQDLAEVISFVQETIPVQKKEQ